VRIAVAAVLVVACGSSACGSGRADEPEVAPTPSVESAATVVEPPSTGQPPPQASAPAIEPSQSTMSPVVVPPPPVAEGGLRIQEVLPGHGRPAKAGDKLTVHYVGTLQDGTEFDSSKKRQQPFVFELGKNHVISGWEKGLVGMRVGGRRRLEIPPDLAYGERGAGGKIPPNATLLFEIDLLSID
jgi:peptidylprolyl isomerase